jgi:Tol biopolymer transport system component
MPVLRTFLVTALAVAVLLPATADARIAYSRPDGVYVAADNGSGARRIVKGHATVDGISADGRRVLYSTSDGAHSFTQTLHVKTVDGGKRTLLRRRAGTLFALTADGHYVAALSGDPESDSRKALTLYVISVRTAAHRTIAHGALADFDRASFSPDSKQLVYDHTPASASAPTSDLYVVSATGTTSHAITHDGHSTAPAWGPKLIAYAHFTRAGAYAHRNIWLANPDGSQRKALTKDEIGEFDDGFDPLGWSADGNRLLTRYDGTDVFGMVVDTATGTEHRFPRNIGLELQAISKDGATVLGYQGAVRGHSGTEVVTRPAAGGASTILARNAAVASWTR